MPYGTIQPIDAYLQPILVLAAVATRVLTLSAVVFVQQAQAFDLHTALTFEGVGKQVDEAGFPVQNGLPLDDLYNTPKPLPYAEPGTLIKHDEMPFPHFTSNVFYRAHSILPSGVSAYRFTYHSRSLTGSDVASSAVLFLPPGPPPAGGWPVIAWAHGSSGVARNCAPSAMKDAMYGDTGLYGFLNSEKYPNTSPYQHHKHHPSYAVVATDYTGLGTDFPHEYLARVAHGLDVIYSIPAAHSVMAKIGKPGILSRKWVVNGHSQGGQAALSVAELETVINDPNYLGAVAIAPLTYLVDTLKSMTHMTHGQGGYFPYVVYGLRTIYPWLQYEDFMTPAALAVLKKAPMLPPAPTPETQLGCIYAAVADDGFGVFTTHTEIYRAGPDVGLNNLWLNIYSMMNQPGTIKANRPIFVVQGRTDDIIPVSLTDRAVRTLCDLGDRVWYKTYPLTKGNTYPPHTDAIYASFDDQMTWIGSRFANHSAPTSCK